MIRSNHYIVASIHKTVLNRTNNSNRVSVATRIPGTRVGDGAQVPPAGHGARREEPPVGARQLLQELGAVQLGHLADGRRGRGPPRQPAPPQGHRRHEEAHHQCQARVQREIELVD